MKEPTFEKTPEKLVEEMRIIASKMELLVSGMKVCEKLLSQKLIELRKLTDQTEGF